MQGGKLLTNTYSRTDFNNLPAISSRFYDLGFKMVNHDRAQISVSGRLDLELSAPNNVVAIAELKQGDSVFAQQYFSQSSG